MTEEAKSPVTFDIDEIAEDGKDAVQVGENVPLFCELLVLRSYTKGNRSVLVWREMARWIKFEENVEEGGCRWSKPFVASLSFTSLVDLRDILSNTTSVSLSNVKCLDDMWCQVIDAWIWAGKLDSSLRDIFLDTFRQNVVHNHQPITVKQPQQDCQGSRSLSEIVRMGSTSLFQKFDHHGHSKSLVTFSDVSENSHLNFADRSSGVKYNSRFHRKLPSDIEAANLLVAELEFLSGPLCAFVRLSDATVFDNLTEVPIPTRYVFVLFGPHGSADRLWQTGRAMGTLFSDEVFQQQVRNSEEATGLLKGIDGFLAQTTVLPRSEWDPQIRIEPPKRVPAHKPSNEGNTLDTSVDKNLDPDSDQITDIANDEGLMRTGKIFGGLIGDIKRKVPFYLSDFRDALNGQCVATFIFLYLASMTPLITFGGLMSTLLKGRMGAVETILARSVSGVIWGMTAGQPIAILSCTGPNLVYESIVFHMCETLGIDYLPFRVWIGLWSMFEMLLIVAFDLCSLVRYITRFTVESFAALVSVIFIYKSGKSLIMIASHIDEVQQAVSSNATILADTTQLNQPSPFADPIFLLSLILFAGTYLVASVLKGFKSSAFFPVWVRNFISDFAIIISITIFVGFDYALQLPTPKLSVPEGVEPTYEGREGSWIVPFFGENPWWTAFAAIIPGTLGTIMTFMDQQITTVIVNRKENKLKKSKGYHLDLIIVALLTGTFSLLGMPWMIADTVLSLTHVNSLRVDSSVAAPGQRPVFLGIREQRVTNILIAICCGASIFMTPVLELVPMPVLFGVFLFMGLSALNGLQFTDRVKLLFMPLKYQPDYAYLRHVRIGRVHMFTLVQLGFFVILWALKSFKETAALFPLMVGGLVGVRKLLDFVFTQEELVQLDDVLPKNQTTRSLGQSAPGSCEKPDVDEPGFGDNGKNGAVMVKLGKRRWNKHDARNGYAVTDSILIEEDKLTGMTA